MKRIKISIVTVSFNSEATIEETIKSVLEQDYDNLEYLIIDGGSNDNTLSIVNKYREKIDVVVSEKDKGISDAFNKGIDKSTGEIIGIINSDDLLLPGALQSIADVYDSGVDVYRGNTILWNDQTGAKNRSIPTMEFPATSFKHKAVCHQSTFVRKDAYKRFGAFRVDYRFAMDVELLTRLYEHGAKFKYVPADLALFRQGGITDKHSFWEKRKEIYGIVVNNGGGRIAAVLIMIKFIVYQFLKKQIFRFGSDRVRAYKYKYNGKI